VIFGLFNHSECQLIEWQDYLRNAAHKFITLLEQREITGNGMPMGSFNAAINQKLYDIEASGVARYHSGFIAKIDASGILSTSLQSPTVLEGYCNVKCIITFDGVQTVYDVDYEYENFKGRGTVLIWFKQLQFDMSITRNHTTNDITSEIRYLSIGNQYDIVVKLYPNNGYTQLTAREIKQSGTYREPIIESFKNWTVMWRSDLDAAVSEYKFPEICYYCP